MDWWLVPVGLGVAGLLWFLWEAAFHSGETVTTMPELDGYIPRRHRDRDPLAPTESQPSASASPTEPDDALVTPSEDDVMIHDGPLPERADAASGLDGSDESVGGPNGVPDDQAVDEGGIWIELDIEPLFPSSDATPVLDLTHEQDSEAAP